ncbi:MAG TPA: GerMN domain-containing protein [Roseiflexaceae bacterium]|nr:GerMN domain-containing protein [Roseiflexaceae bacterium]HMP39029.1 GerMN domain-containing protein [Roseiflexaceae bacterium]
MSEPTGHCPYLGLKQNRAIRFSTPTLEHRCFVGGDPIEIPVDQSSYCLSSKHIQCPLYMGLSAPTTPTLRPTPMPVTLQPGGLRGWLATLSPRDRTIYAIMIGILSLITMIYLVVGLQSLLGIESVAAVPTPTSVPPAATATATTPAAPPTATIPPATPTSLPTGTSEPVPTNSPTQAAIIILPTLVTTDTPIPPTATGVVVPPTATGAAATDTPIVITATRVPATAVPRVPTATRVPATAVPQVPTATSAPVATSRERLWLYFGDTTGTLFVPVQRMIEVRDRQPATAAVRELIAGPRNGLDRLLNPETRLLGIVIENGTATVNFDRDPANGDYPRALQSVVLTLTHFATIERVQFQINGANIGIDGNGLVQRPVVNPLNPQGLAFDYGATEFLPLYFLGNDGYHMVRVIRMVPKTKQTAHATLQALLEGPGAYSYALQRTIPAGTTLHGVSLENGIATVNFSTHFVEAADRSSAVGSVVDSLTTLSTIQGVQFLVDGQSLAHWWGSPFGDVYRRPLINPE